MDTIINPVDGIKYSLHSTRGRELLKLYINNYKLGGSATLAGSPWIFENVKQFFSNAVDSVKGIFKKRDDTLEASMRDASRFTMNPIFKAPEAVIPDKRSSAARKIQRNWLKTKQKLLNRPVSPFTARLRKADGKFPRPIETFNFEPIVPEVELPKDFLTIKVESPVTKSPIPKNIYEVIKQNRIRAVELTGLQRLGHRLDKDEEDFLDQQSEIREQRKEDEEEFEQEVKEFMNDYSESSDPMRDTMASLDSSSEEDLMRNTTAFYPSSSSDEIPLDKIPARLRGSEGLSSSSSYFT